MKRSLSLPLLLLCLASGPALAQKSKPVPAGCKEDFGDCKEDCSTDYGGSTRTYKKLAACIAECNEKMNVCRDRHYTALGSGLDPGALERPREADPAMREPSRRAGRDDLREDEDERPARPSAKERPAAAASREESPAAASEPEVDSGPAPVRRDVYRAPQPEKKSEPKPSVAESAAEAPAYDDSAEEAGSLPPPPPKAEVKPAAMREPARETKPAARVTESNPQDDAEPMPPPPPPKKVEEPKPAPVVRPPPPPEPKKKDISEWDPDAED